MVGSLRVVIVKNIIFNSLTKFEIIYHFYKEKQKSRNFCAVVAGLVPRRNIIYDTSKVNNVPVETWQV